MDYTLIPWKENISYWLVCHNDTQRGFGSCKSHRCKVEVVMTINACLIVLIKHLVMPLYWSHAMSNELVSDTIILTHLIKKIHAFTSFINQNKLWNIEIVNDFSFQKSNNYKCIVFFYKWCFTLLGIMVYCYIMIRFMLNLSTLVCLLPTW